ncbi:MAG: PaaI family thioesterase, partial [Pseudomonadales bacterium]|nr:PaaI family thioesterase [Pseudomonadales bacterium]
MSEAPEGYLTMAGYDPAEDSIGPFYYRQLPDGSWRYAFFPEDKHCNASGIIHGGVLMTLADYALCMAATDHYAEENCVTVTFSSE